MKNYHWLIIQFKLFRKKETLEEEKIEIGDYQSNEIPEEIKKFLFIY